MYVKDLCLTLDFDNVKRMDKILHFGNVDSILSKHSTNISEPVFDILTYWLNKQNSPEEAFIKLGEALIHPDVGLNLIAREVLNCPFQDYSLSAGETISSLPSRGVLFRPNFT